MDNLKEAEINIAANIVSKVFYNYFRDIFELLEKVEDHQAIVDLNYIVGNFELTENKSTETLNKVAKINSEYIKKFRDNKLGNELYLYALFDLMVCFAIGFLVPPIEVKKKEE